MSLHLLKSKLARQKLLSLLSNWPTRPYTSTVAFIFHFRLVLRLDGQPMRFQFWNCTWCIVCIFCRRVLKCILRWPKSKKHCPLTCLWHQVHRQCPIIWLPYSNDIYCICCISCICQQTNTSTYKGNLQYNMCFMCSQVKASSVVTLHWGVLRDVLMAMWGQ